VKKEELLTVACGFRAELAASMLPKQIKVYWFFFSKKNCFLPRLTKRENDEAARRYH
jgi:hypothetical protein